MDSITPLISETVTLAGFAVAIVWYLLKRDTKAHDTALDREQRMADRISHIENGQRERLEQLSRDSTAALLANTTAVAEVTSALREVRCLRDDKRETVRHG